MKESDEAGVLAIGKVTSPFEARGMRVRIPRTSRPIVDRTPRAFEELLSEHLDALYRLALRLCRGRTADAEDLLHDAMLRGFRGFETLRDPEAARAWLYTTLVRTNSNRLRSQRRRAEDLATDLDDGQFEAALADWHAVRTPADELDRRELRARLTTALDALDAELRAVVWLADVEGLRQREVASIVGVPEGTVASRLFRARRELRTALAEGRAPATMRGQA